jgi:hypothetical protein
MGYLITDEVIQTIGHGIENDWKNVAKYLKLNRTEIQQIEKQTTDNKVAAVMMLEKWKMKDTTGDEHKLFILRKTLTQLKKQELLNYLGTYENTMLSLT